MIDTPQQKYGQLLARIEAVVVPRENASNARICTDIYYCRLLFF